MTLWHGGSIVIAVLEEVMSRTTRRRAVRAVAPVAGLLAAGLLKESLIQKKKVKSQ